MSVHEATQRVADCMDKILTNFKEGAKITVLVRYPQKPNADFCLTDDDLDEVIAMVRRRKGEAPPQTNLQSKPLRISDAENAEAGAKAVSDLIDNLDAAAIPQQDHVMPIAPWREQSAFEAWAKENRYEMHQHPLHYLFMDKQTNAARQGWKAALQFTRETQQSSPETSSKEADLPVLTEASLPTTSRLSQLEARTSCAASVNDQLTYTGQQPQYDIDGADLLATVKEFARWHHLNELTIYTGGKPSDSEIDFEVTALNTIKRAIATTEGSA